MRWTMMLVLLLACLGVGKALKPCYQCTGLDDGCNDPFDKEKNNAYLVNCPATLDACGKVKLLGSVSRFCTSVASCKSGDVGDNGCAVANDKNSMCCCTGDGCNSATTRQVSYVALAAMMFVAKAVF